MNWLRQKINENRSFVRVLALAIGCNLIIIGLFAMISYSVKDITVTVNGKTAQYKTVKNSVSDMLTGWGVTLDEKDVVKPGMNNQLKDGTNVEIDLFEVYKETVSEATDFETKTEYTSDLLEGETEITTEGVKGEDSVTYEVTTLGGVEQSRKEIARTTVKEPVTQIVAEGTAVSYNGVKYSRVIRVVATGYTHTGHRTATGTKPHRGTMAVDRRVVAMGSYGYVPGYGEVHAEDTGGAIKGNRIDLFFNTRGQAISWGRRTVDLYIK
ncbi:MAG: G5 domain-containing protein [Clostridia bacterium]|nr:G5 domain-containing protein [Clostridia bacterium]